MSEKKQSDQFHYNTEPTSDNTLHTLLIEKKRLIVPVIFIPGVMGSNLKEKTGKINSKIVWRLDGSSSLLGWAMPFYGGASARKLELDPDKTMVDNRGKIVEAFDAEVARIRKEYNPKIALYRRNHQYNEVMNIEKERNEKIKKAKENNPENRLFGSRRARGWGTVGYMSYGEFLDKLQNSLFATNGQMPKVLQDLIKKEPMFKLDEGSKTSLKFKDEQIEHCNQFYFPVHAMGYNWLESNGTSANALKRLVEVTLPNYYKKRGQKCDKVILITHSMGGLVARYYTQAIKGSAKVYGVIHGVQPATGAVAAYTRMKRGTEVNSTFFKKPIGAIAENILGKDAAEMTAVCAQAPGPLQLLPTPQYGKYWLTIKTPNGEKESYPKSDPYKEIYLAKDKWWCACEPHLINPCNVLNDKEQMLIDWQSYKDIINNHVKSFNQSIANKYHPNTYAFFGIDKDPDNIERTFLTYNSAFWRGKKVDKLNLIKIKLLHGSNNRFNRHIGDQKRLVLNELHGSRTLKSENGAEEYTLSSANGNGDGTVSQRSGQIPIEYLTARMHFPVEHEPAYKSKISQDFTLRAIVDIMNKVK